jgi:ribosomal-protein-alanine N-acetyltransferase
VGERHVVEIRAARATDRAELGRFFEENNRPQVTRQFHPFPLTVQGALDILSAERFDRFYVATTGPRIVAFCMLRGWDEGYDVPSFGILVDYRVYGRGLGRQVTEFAIAEARRLGSAHVRLTVYASNHHAVRLYESLGFAEVQRERVLVAGQSDMKITMLKRLDGSGE